jgi:hypothetical protein
MTLWPFGLGAILHGPCYQLIGRGKVLPNVAFKLHCVGPTVWHEPINIKL